MALSRSSVVTESAVRAAWPSGFGSAWVAASRAPPAMLLIGLPSGLWISASLQSRMSVGVMTASMTASLALSSSLTRASSCWFASFMKSVIVTPSSRVNSTSIA